MCTYPITDGRAPPVSTRRHAPKLPLVDHEAIEKTCETSGCAPEIDSTSPINPRLNPRIEILPSTPCSRSSHLYIYHSEKHHKEHQTWSSARAPISASYIGERVTVLGDQAFAGKFCHHV